jgi:hypothetical protein
MYAKFVYWQFVFGGVVVAARALARGPEDLGLGGVAFLVVTGCANSAAGVYRLIYPPA